MAGFGWDSDKGQAAGNKGDNENQHDCSIPWFSKDEINNCSNNQQ